MTRYDIPVHFYVLTENNITRENSSDPDYARARHRSVEEGNGKQSSATECPGCPVCSLLSAPKESWESYRLRQSQKSTTGHTHTHTRIHTGQLRDWDHLNATRARNATMTGKQSA